MELIHFLSFLFIMFVFVLRISRNNKSTKKLPPGPWKLPLIGNIHHLITFLPHRRLRDLAEIHGPIMHLQLGQLTNIVISAPETASEVLKTHDITFSERPRLLAAKVIAYNCVDIAFAPYGDYWRQMRKICTVELLTAKRVESFKSIRKEQVSKLITSISAGSEAGSPINFSSMVGSLIYSIVSRSAFGKIWEGEDVFIAAVKELVGAAGGFDMDELYPSLKILQVISRMNSALEMIQEKMDKILQSIIDEHRARKAAGGNRPDDDEDFVGVLLKIQDEGDLEFPLRDENIKAVVLDMFGAGTESSSITIEWTMSELMKSPRAMKKVQEEVRRVFDKEQNVDESRLYELNYLKLVIKETLRLHPPAPLLPRGCREKSSVYGFDIPEKSKVIVNVWAMGRDPNYWNEPDKFFPERFINTSIDYKGAKYEYLPFGAGRRMCPGLTNGMINVEFPLAQLSYHYDWKLLEGMTQDNLDMLETFGLFVKRKNDLFLIPVSYRKKVLMNKNNFNDAY